MESKNKRNGLLWAEIAREIQALAQTGLTFASNHWEIDRNKRLMEIAEEIVLNKTLLEDEPIMETFTTQPGYATPKVDVRAAIIKDGKILLVKEVSDGKWCMPGGWADVGEYPSEMVIREAREESGFDVKPVKVIGVFDANRGGRPMQFFHAYKVVFLCEIMGGEATPSEETTEVEFFDFENLPEFSPNRTNEKHIAEIRKHLEDKSRGVYFD
ncbi:MAG: ADP-ribose pyrophosphatase [Melioribacteraceae bacterium]|nr:MAG: ADP-ribose pyrophosphatase [Melioribacteraceae bacterium]